MMATKEQERKALADIMEIVKGLGADSYVGKAFEGCFEIAEENIQNDFFISMKERYEDADKKAKEFMKGYEQAVKDQKGLKEEFEKALNIKEQENERQRKMIENQTEALGKMTKWGNEKSDEAAELAVKLNMAENEIIRLKAKLYDCIVK